MAYRKTKYGPYAPGRKTKEDAWKLPLIGELPRQVALMMIAMMAIVVAASGVAIVSVTGKKPDFGAFMIAESRPSVVIVSDNTDRKLMTPNQEREVSGLLLNGHKRFYTSGSELYVTVLGQAGEPALKEVFRETSPGNGDAANSWLETPERAEEKWERFVPDFQRNLQVAMQPVPDPQHTLLINGLERALELAGPGGRILLVSDMLIHEPKPGISAYAAVGSASDPSVSLRDRAAAAAPEGVKVDLIMISRRGRKSRGRDLGDLQDRSMAALKAYLERRGVKVTLIRKV